ncbi:alanine racemase [Corticicoccus populi]|uniref:Alanine racemase n=1 Tax=Corticicoccus populi TaxID=1812821 RepID=A0ABW5WVM3_9STAP
MGGTFSINQKEFINQAQNITKNIPTIAVVKNNAYNHGLEFSVKCFIEAGIKAFGTTNIAEAVKIREINQEVRIFLMNPTAEFDAVRQYQLDITLPSLEYYKKYQQSLNGINVHLEYAGLFNRSGFNSAEEMLEVLHHEKKLDETERFNLTGLWTHFGYADEFDGVYEEEREGWLSIVETFQKRDIRIPVIHAQNTASFVRDGLFDGHTHLRLGVGLYGGTPYEEAPGTYNQSISLSAPVIQIRPLSKGMPCGYSAAFVAKKDTKAAVVDIGYGDGIMRSRASYECEINGKMYPIRALMMSHMLVEVDDCVSTADTVYIYNKNLRVDDFRNRGIGAVSEQLGALNFQTLKQEVY